MPINEDTLRQLRNGLITDLDLKKTDDEGAASLTDDDVRRIAEACRDKNSLNSIDLSHNEGLTDTAIEHLSNIKSLQEITLRGLTITGNCLHLFANLKKLYKINLGGCFDITLEAYVELFRVCPDLANVHISPFFEFKTDIAIALSRLPKLITLSLANSNDLTTKFFEELIKSRTITHLNLQLCNLSDAHIEPLAVCAKTTTVIIKYNRITDLGIKTLCQMPNLEWLNAACNRVTDDGLMTLATCKRLRFCDVSEQKSPTGLPIKHSKKLLSELENLATRNEGIYKGKILTSEVQFIETVMTIAQGARQDKTPWFGMPEEAIVDILLKSFELDWRTKFNVTSTILLVLRNIKTSPVKGLIWNQSILINNKPVQFFSTYKCKTSPPNGDLPKENGSDLPKITAQMI